MHHCTGSNLAGVPPSCLYRAPASAPTWAVRSRPKTRRVILYERRGFNRSAASPARHMRQHAADAAALLTHLEAEPATILGWSGGGLVALALAVEHPEVVESLIVVEPSLHMIKHVSGSLLATMASGIYARLIQRNPEAATDLLYRWVFSYSTGGSAYDRFPEKWRLELRRNSAAINKESAQEAGLSFWATRLGDKLRAIGTWSSGSLRIHRGNLRKPQSGSVSPQAPTRSPSGDPAQRATAGKLSRPAS